MDLRTIARGFVLGVLALVPCMQTIPLVYAATDDEEEQEEAKPVAVDVYDLKLSLKVPQVLDNMESQGYREFKSQTIRGEMHIVWTDDGNYRLEFSSLQNQQFKVRGAKVTYDGAEDRAVVYTHFNWIGSNKTGIFKTPAMCFFLELLPNYAIGDASEDNSFYLLLAGKGISGSKKSLGAKIATRFSGYVAGSQGCGCYAYGHLSPTRDASMMGPSNRASDVVATYGSWRAKWKRRYVCR